MGHIDLDAVERRRKKPKAARAAELREEYAKVMAARGEPLKSLGKSQRSINKQETDRVLYLLWKSGKEVEEIAPFLGIALDDASVRLKALILDEIASVLRVHRRSKKSPRSPVIVRTKGERPKKVYSTPQGKAYAAYMESGAWAAKRREYWRSAGYDCKAKNCHETKNLHVHHHTYERLGNEHLSDLVGLCIPHHEAVHAYHKKHRCTLTEATEKVTGLSL